MRQVTREMINKFNLKKLGIDFMGYEFERKEELSFHHLIIPKRECPKLALGQGYYDWNCAILVQDTSHNYLHVIERYETEMFNAITSEMIDENIKGYLDMQNLKAISDILDEFEAKYKGVKMSNGELIIKDIFTERAIKKGVILCLQKK